jgi:hypothetical protein
LYIAGRAHKPVRPLRELPAELELLVANNLRSALSAALLLLPLRFDDAGLFGTICGLSYSGDVRMGIGESPRKPGDIADGQRDALAELYRGPLAEATGSIGGSVGSSDERGCTNHTENCDLHCGTVLSRGERDHEGGKCDASGALSLACVTRRPWPNLASMVGTIARQSTLSNDQCNLLRRNLEGDACK